MTDAAPPPAFPTGTPPPALAAAPDPRAQAERLAEALAAPATRSTRLSVWIGGGLFIAFLLLAALAPIASGIVAMGALAPAESRQTVQHETGGVVAEILVSEGDQVAAGDLLVRLAGVQEGAEAGAAGVTIASLRAEEAARSAEAAGAAVVAFPDDLLTQAESDPEVQAILDTQRAAFASRRDQRQVALTQIDAQRAQLRDQSAAAQARRASARTQIGLIRQEAAGLRSLYERGLAPLPRVLALERAAADLEGQEAALRAEISRIAAEDRELAARRREIVVAAEAEANEALRAVRGDLAAGRERQVAVDDALARTAVTAPMAGRVLNLSARTVGGVVRAGEPILEIVPTTDLLVVRARVRPQDGDDVRVGQAARIRFDVLGQGAAPRLRGRVASVSADALEDERTGMTYFEARVEIPPDEAARLPETLLSPGLPAEVLIETGSTTLLGYLFAPIDRFTFRALREN